MYLINLDAIFSAAAVLSLATNSGRNSARNSGTLIKGWDELRDTHQRLGEFRDIHQIAIFLEPTPPFAHGPQLTEPASCGHCARQPESALRAV